MMEVVIDGLRFRTYLTSLGVRQKEVAKKAGVTKFTVNRWCTMGRHAVKLENMQAVAEAIGVTTDNLIQQVAVGEDSDALLTSGLTPAEKEWLELYRGLPPLDQAKVRLAVEDLLNPTRPPASRAKRT